MKYISIFFILILFTLSGGVAVVADVVGANGSSCDYNGQGVGSGVMQDGACREAALYQSQSQTQTPGAPAGPQSGFTALAPIPGLTDSANTSVVNASSLANFFNNLYKYLIGIAAMLAIIEIIWGGLEISTKDSVSKKSDGKERITQALLGLVLVLAPVLVFSIINPSILNLSLNLPELSTKTTFSVTAGSSAALPPAPATGCTLARKGDYVEIAVCANMTAATSYSCSNGQDLKVPPCPLNAANNACDETKPIVVSCSKTLTLNAYQYYTGVGKLTGPIAFVPSDQSAADAFYAGCAKDGGKYSVSLTTAARVFTSTNAYLISNGCSSDYKVAVDSAKGRGVACFGNVLSCGAPQ